MDVRTFPVTVLAFLVVALSGGLGPTLAWVVAGAGIYLLPGFCAAALLGPRAELLRPGTVALSLVLSVGIYNLCGIIAVVFGGSLSLYVTLGALAGLALAAATILKWPKTGGMRLTRSEWFAWLVATAALLPMVLRYAGGGIDDWWDLAFVRALSDRGTLDFAEPILGSGAIHPRFSWNVWLLSQAVMTWVAGVDPVDVQAAFLAPLVCVATVSATAALARQVFGGEANTRVNVAIVAVPAWLYGTDAMPFFVRVHQDKFVAALVFLPIVLAATLSYLRTPSLRSLLLFALCVTGMCSVHTLVFGIAVIGIVVCTGVRALERQDATSRKLTLWHLAGVAAVVCVAASYPVWQAWHLGEWFAGQGVSLDAPDNPVVRAHLALDRLLAPLHAHVVVNPGAVFGPIGAVALIGALVSFRRRDDGDAMLLGLTLVPAVLMFTPWVAGLVGAAMVPWMLYRLGWLIPQALLIARAAPLAQQGRRTVRQTVAMGLYVACVLALVVPAAADRTRRGMREHPSAAERRPRGSTLEVYRFLRESERRGVVVAPVGFSNLVPAMTGRPVVAYSERGTVVFDGHEARAYRRLRDRAKFFSCSVDPTRRAEIARDYGIAHAVFRRRIVPRGDEVAWVERSSAEGLLKAEDLSSASTCAQTREQLSAGLPALWKVVFENPDFFVVATDTEGRTSAGRTLSTDAKWHEPFALVAGDAERSGEVLASTAGFPGGYLALTPVPAGLGVGPELVWIGGPASWDDGPSEVKLEISPGQACEISGIEIVPYLDTRRREVFAVEVDGKVWRMLARDGIPLRIPLEPRSRPGLEVSIRSMLGIPFGIADLRLVGRRASCEGGWQPLGSAMVTGRPPSVSEYLALQTKFPSVPRLSGAPARARADEGAAADAITLLRRALAREGRQAHAWIEYGLQLDAAGFADDAFVAYQRARAADSNSAWAEGCLAWAAVRSDAALRGAYHAWRAYSLDDRYADALTIAGLAAERLALPTLSAAALERAIKMEPRRSWPYFERARQLAGAQRQSDAAVLISNYVKLVPGDTAAIKRLRALEDGRGVN